MTYSTSILCACLECETVYCEICSIPDTRNVTRMRHCWVILVRLLIQSCDVKVPFWTDTLCVVIDAVVVSNSPT